MSEVTVRFFASARAAAGKSNQSFSPDSVANILELCASGNQLLATVLPQCSVLIDGLICHDHEQFVLAGSELDILPKFAGG